MNYRLMRTWYDTDVTPEDPDYIGSFSRPFPARALQDGTTIVDVDWSEFGKVQVTYLIPA